jgi:hypothetical protein
LPVIGLSLTLVMAGRWLMPRPTGAPRMASVTPVGVMIGASLSARDLYRLWVKGGDLPVAPEVGGSAGKVRLQASVFRPAQVAGIDQIPI